MNIFSKIHRFLVGHRMRVNYWTNSRLAKYIQKKVGVKKPGALPLGEWGKWDDQFKKDHPVIYWITEEGFDIAQDIVYFPYDVYYNARIYIRNRFIDKPHYLDTKLERGVWHENDVRMMHALYQLVIDFVEIEKAHMHDICHEEHEQIKDRREAGIAYLDWEISLDDDVDDPQTAGIHQSQASAAKNLKEIYLWIKDVRPNRPDPGDVSGWKEYADARSNKELFGDRSEEEKAESRKILKEYHTIEEAQYDEDTTMMKRIVDLRQSMWT